jgi:hypothetical protein
MEKSANYYEPHMRVAVAKALRALRTRIGTADIAHAIMARQTRLFRREDLEALLKPALQVRRRAFKRGGQIGAQKVRAL